MFIVPIIDKILEQDGIFYGLNENEDVIFATQYKAIADAYFAIPSVLKKQSETISNLTTSLTNVTEEYNSIIMGLRPSGSNLVH